MSNVRRNVATSAGLVVLGLVAGIMIAQIGSAAAGTGQQAVNTASRGAPTLDEVVPQGAFVRVVDDTRPALVFIRAEQAVDTSTDSFFGRFFDDSATYEFYAPARRVARPIRGRPGNRRNANRI